MKNLLSMFQWIDGLLLKTEKHNAWKRGHGGNSFGTICVQLRRGSGYGMINSTFQEMGEFHVHKS